jgi:Holliday junction resolvasome RuvABC endonuclease subunit
MSQTLLALDPSSTNIGWSLWDIACGRLIAGGTLKLGGKNLAIRLSAARVAIGQLITNLLADHPIPGAVAYEYGAFASTGRDEQQQALGVIRMVLYELLGLSEEHTIKVAPNAAKKALTGYGKRIGTHDEDKQRMIDASAAHITGADDHAADSAAVAIGAISLIMIARREHGLGVTG